MAVVCQALNVLIKTKTLDAKYPGGLKGYIKDVPNNTFCTDGKLTRVGFMAPQDVGSRINHLETCGLIFTSCDYAIDICVADEREGPTTNCEWIDQYMHNSSDYSYACIAGEIDNNIFYPQGFESKPMTFIEKDNVNELEITGMEGYTESYIIDGEEKHIGRTSEDSLDKEKMKTTKILKSKLKKIFNL